MHVDVTPMFSSNRRRSLAMEIGSSVGRPRDDHARGPRYRCLVALAEKPPLPPLKQDVNNDCG